MLTLFVKIPTIRSFSADSKHSADHARYSASAHLLWSRVYANRLYSKLLKT